MAKKKSAVKKVGGKNVAKAVKTTAAKKKKTKKKSSSQILRGKKFKPESNIWVDVKRDWVVNRNGSVVEYIDIPVDAKGAAAQSFADFDYQVEYLETNGSRWVSTSIEPYEPVQRKDGVIKAVMARASTSRKKGELLDEELVVAITTVKSSKA